MKHEHEKDRLLSYRGVFKFVTFLAALFFMLSSKLALAQSPEVSHLIITDVTPVSFSVVWTASEPSTCNLKVFRDSQGLQPVTSANITPMPVESGDTSIAQKAEGMGVMKVRVTGLLPNTDYFFQTLTTSKDTSEITAYPETPPYERVRTASRNTCAVQVGQDLLPFSNEMIKVECLLLDDVTPAEGTLLLAYAFGSSYPVSMFVGDGAPVPYAFIDLGNVISGHTNQNIYLPGNESLILVQYMGIQGYRVLHYGVPCNELLSQFVTPMEKETCISDFAGDGVVDSTDLEVFAWLLGFTDGLQPEAQPLWGDLDGDGDVDGIDTALMAFDYLSSGCPKCQ